MHWRTSAFSVLIMFQRSCCPASRRSPRPATTSSSGWHSPWMSAGCHTSEQIEQALDQLDEQGIDYEILFIDAPDDVLMRRYSETRRRHPISIAEGISTREALAKERQILQPFRERADYTINTEFLSTAQNKERICNLFAPDGGGKGRNAAHCDVLRFQVRHPGGCEPCAGCPLPAQPFLYPGAQA